MRRRLHCCGNGLLLTVCCRLENESKPRVERGKTVVESTGAAACESFFQ
jgi:hypothetical protein